MYEVISGADLPAFGPYSPAVRAGQLIFVAAQVGVDPDTGVPPASCADECRQALRNLARVVERAGSDMRHVVRTTLLYTDFGDLPAINEVYAEVFPTDPPTRTSARVGLPGGRRIAIDAIAAVVD